MQPQGFIKKVDDVFLRKLIHLPIIDQKIFFPPSELRRGGSFAYNWITTFVPGGSAMKRMMIIALSLVLVLTATPAFAYEDNPGMIIMDTLLVRPISMAAVVIGTAAFIVTLPFA